MFWKKMRKHTHMYSISTDCACCWWNAYANFPHLATKTFITNFPKPRNREFHREMQRATVVIERVLLLLHFDLKFEIFARKIYNLDGDRARYQLISTIYKTIHTVLLYIFDLAFLARCYFVAFQRKYERF